MCWRGKTEREDEDQLENVDLLEEREDVNLLEEEEKVPDHAHFALLYILLIVLSRRLNLEGKSSLYIGEERINFDVESHELTWSNKCAND